MLRRLLLPLFALSSAQAAVVRGHVTTALGTPAPGARVQLIRITGGARSVADTITGPDGSFEVRSDSAGRFVLLTSPSVLSTTLAPQISPAFYAGRTDLVLREIALNAAIITPQTSSAATLRETPIAQLATSPSQLDASRLLPQADILPTLEPNPSVFILQQGQTGTPATLYLRGAAPETIKVTLDGLSIENLGGGFNLATLSSTGLASSTAAPTAEILPVPNPLRAVDAQAGILALHTPESATVRPALTYTGDAGPLGTYRNELTLSAAPTRTDLFASASRFDTSNDDAVASPYHLASAAANLGYHISSATSLRATARRDLSASAFAPPFDLFRLPPTGKLTSANTYATFTFETRTAGNWHNLLSYGLARKQAVLQLFTTPATGGPITITGANGYTASAIAALPPLPTREDDATARDEFTYQTDRPVKPWLTPLFTFRYQDEHAARTLSEQPIPTERTTLERTHLSGALAFSGEFRHRVFYQASGFLDHNPTLGTTGSPSLGLTYAPVRPGARRFRGTTLHLTAATGLRETPLAAPTRTPPHTRTFEASIDQAILARKLSLHAAYFHNQFSHDFETLTQQIPSTLSQTLAYRTQGLESTLLYRPRPAFTLTGGYTYLAALVEQSAATPAFNPAFPLIPIGALTALPGARPFHRPPNTGFASAAYNGRKLTATLTAAVAGRSDDSTNLPQTPALLLPNRNLSLGYTSLNASATYTVSRRITAFTQLTNLFDDRHIAPIGYTSTPFLIRTGLRIRLGGE